MDCRHGQSLDNEPLLLVERYVPRTIQGHEYFLLHFQNLLSSIYSLVSEVVMFPLSTLVAALRVTMFSLLHFPYQKLPA